MAGAVTELEAQFELVDFEQVEAAPGTALLRVSGRPAGELHVGHLWLVIDDDGGAEHRYEQLPALPGPPGLLRAAFSAPLDHLGAGASFSLELPDGQLVRLPAPARRSTALSATPAPPEGPAVSELERRLRSERERRSAAESDLIHVRRERDEARAELDAALTDRDQATAERDQAEARARASAAHAGALEGQITAAEDAAIHMQAAHEAQLADRASELERMRSAAEIAQARAAANRRELTAREEQLAHAQAQIAVLRESVEPREAEPDAALARRAAEVELLRAQVQEHRDDLDSLKHSRHELVAAAEATQHALETERARAETAEAHSRQLSEAVRVAAEARVRAEEALLETAAQQAIAQQPLPLDL